MSYNKKDLQKLWNILKNKRCIINGEKTGLTQVEFYTPLPDFQKKYEEETKKSHNTQKTTITNNIEQVIQEITNKEITFHHLTCAARTENDTTALCIHYEDQEKTRCAITLPGINYEYN